MMAYGVPNKENTSKQNKYLSNGLDTNTKGAAITLSTPVIKLTVDKAAFVLETYRFSSEKCLFPIFISSTSQLGLKLINKLLNVVNKPDAKFKQGCKNEQYDSTHLDMSFNKVSLNIYSIESLINTKPCTLKLLNISPNIDKNAV